MQAILQQFVPRQPDEEIIREVKDTDILCGKDKTFNLHKGNIRYRELIEAHGTVYAIATSKQAKTKITRAVLQILEQENARFLQPEENGGWSIVPRQKARDKTSHALRFYCQHHRPEMMPQRSIAPRIMNGENAQRRIEPPVAVISSPPSSTRSWDNNVDTFDTLRSQDIRDIIDDHHNMEASGDTLRSQDIRMILDEPDFMEEG